MWARRAQRIVLAAALSCVAACEHLQDWADAPTRISIRPNQTDEVLAVESARLTRQGEILNRLEPFVSEDSTVQLRVQLINLPAASEPTPTSAALPDYVIIGRGGQAPDVLPLNAQQFSRLVLQYRDDRILQVNRLCDAYFTDLDRIAGNTDFGTASLNTIGDYASVIMGLTGAPAKQLAILAGTQAALNETVDSARALLLLSPAPSTVRGLIEASQRRQVVDISANRAPTHQVVETFIQGYAEGCTPIGIRRVVTQAVTERAQAEDPDRTSLAGQSLLVNLQAILNEGLTPAQRITSLDETAAANLLWLAEAPECTVDACPIRSQVRTRYPLLVEAFDGKRVVATAALKNLAAAEPSVATRRDLLQTRLIDEQRAAATQSLQESSAALERRNDDLQRRLDALDARLKALPDLPAEAASGESSASPPAETEAPQAPPTPTLPQDEPPNDR